MQHSGQEFFFDRLLYYSIFPIQSQSKRGKWDYKLCPVIMVGILSYTTDIDEDREIFYYDIRERYNSELISNKLRFILVEVDRFDKDIDENSSQRDKWLYVLKNLPRLLERPEALKNRIFEKLFEISEVAALSEYEQIEYIKSMRTENDILNQIDYAMKKGMEKGKTEEKLEIARAMKEKGMSNDIISELVSLKIELIENL